MSSSSRPFYITGGTLPRDAASYVMRRADSELFDGLLNGRFCYVLTSRQMGKSSLMVRTAARLRQNGVTCAVLDLTAIGQDLTKEQWFDGLQNALGRQLHIEEPLEEFWLSHKRLSPLSRWSLGLEQVVLERVQGPVILFIDEIDAVRSLPFSADEFFAAIRQLYNQRSERPELERLTFCLLGVASPSDLIRDTRTTPFNIGLRIDLTDFTLDEAKVLSAGMGPQFSANGPQRNQAECRLLTRVLYWTGGHPYLTQRLCQAVAAELLSRGNVPGSRISENDLVDRICAGLLISPQARVQNDNLLFVRDRLLRSEADLAGLLGVYAQILKGKNVRDNEGDPLISVLRLSGITRVDSGRLRVRNRIYSRVFDQAWVSANMPDAEVRRQRAAYRKGLLRATLVWGAAILALAALGTVAKRQADNARAATARSKQYADSLKSALKQADAARLMALNETGKARKAERDLAAALNKAEERRKDADNARHETSVRLRDSYLAQAQASRSSRRIGQKFDSLAALEKASRFPADAEFRARLRDEAIACMALPIDLRPRRTLNLGAANGILAIDSQGRRLAALGNNGIVTIWDMRSGAAVDRFPSGVKQVLWIDFSPGSRFLVAYGKSGAPLRVWDLRKHQIAKDIRVAGISHLVFDRSDSSLYTLGDKGAIRRRNLRNGVETKIAEVKSLPQPRLRLSPDGRRLAHYAIGSNDIRIIDLADGSSFNLEARNRVIQVSWSADGSKISAATGDFNLIVWSVPEGQVISQMAGHLSLPDKLTFLRQDRLLATSGWDSSLRIWDVATGAEVISLPIGGCVYKVSPDSGRLFFAGNGKVQEFEIERGLECRVFAHATGAGNHGIDFLPGSTLMAGAAEDGVRFWDVGSGLETAFLPTGSNSQALFTPDASYLVLRNGLKDQISVSRVYHDGDHNTVRIGLPVAARIAEKTSAMRCSVDGTCLATAADSFISLFDLPGLKGEIIRIKHPGATAAVVSPDKRWAATSGDQAKHVKIYDVSAHRFVKELSTDTLTNAAFSPNGKWLVTGNTQRFQFWRVGTWKLKREIIRAQGTVHPGAIAFSDDGNQIALGYSLSVIHLYDTESGILQASLEGPGESFLTPRPRFSPDGAYLAAGTECGAIYLWDLRRIRARLAGMGLDWKLPPAPPLRRNPRPLKVVFDSLR